MIVIEFLSCNHKDAINLVSLIVIFNESYTLSLGSALSLNEEDTSNTRPYVHLRNIYKRFGDVEALKGVTLDIFTGQVLGLLGENGAGKTTLMNVLFGLYKPDAGHIYVDGKLVKIRSPAQAIKLGIFMVHQHFKLVSNYTALENIAIGITSGIESLKPANLAELKERINKVMEYSGLYVDLKEKIRNLPLGVRQRVEILKALTRGVKVLILDEPTTNLTPQEVDTLFNALRNLVKKGLGVVFITHKLHEVMAVADEIAVLKNGVLLGRFKRSDVDQATVVKLMVGERIDLEKSIIFKGLRPSGTSAQAENTARSELLKVEDICLRDKLGAPILDRVSFSLFRGEILGIAGVSGNGQRELVEILFGVRKPTSGKILMNGIDLTSLPIRERILMGLFYIPEDRLSEGISPTLSVMENLVLGIHFTYTTKKILMDFKRIRDEATQLIKKYEIKTPNMMTLASKLSGGNIQKLMIARAFHTAPKVLIAHNPTRGLDIATTEKVLDEVLSLRDAGSGVIYVSEDLDELMLISDRIAVMYKGRLVGSLPRSRFDKYEIGKLMAGVVGD